MVDNTVWWLAAATLLAVVLYKIFERKGKRGATTVPGLQPSDPKLGNLGDVGVAGSLHEFLSGLHASYGPIVSFYWGQQLTVSIASPQLFREHSKVFARPVELFKMFESLFTSHSIQHTNTAEGRERRHMYDAIFSHTAMIKYYDIIEQIAEEFARTLLATPRDQFLPLADQMLTFAIRSFSGVAFADFFDLRKCKEMKKSYHICWDEMERRLGGEIPGEDDPRQQKFNHERDHMYEMIREALEHRRRNPGGPDELQLVDVLLENGRPEEVKLADGLTFAIGGFHTTGNLLAWIVYYLCRHPEVEERLLRELKDVLKGGSVGPHNKQDLVYTKQVINEALRCSRLAPYAARFEDKDSELGGHVIPAGTPVLHALGVMSGDEKYWPDSDKFDPDRFSGKTVPYSFEPFGFAGKRMCPAYNFAYMEVKIVLAVLLPKLKFVLRDQEEIRRCYKIVTSPEPEVWVAVQPRQ